MQIEIRTPLGFSYLGKRKMQQDAVCPSIQDLCPEDRLFIICDGMGGHSKGEIASNTVVNSLYNHIGKSLKSLSAEEFKKFLEKAWLELDSYYDERLGDSQMGTTLTFLAFTSQGYLAAHIGDSRIYHIRPSKVSEFVYRSTDHSIVANMLADGEITPIEALTFDGRNVLNKAMIPQTRYEPEIFEGTDIRDGDYFMLCSDGVVESLCDDMIRFIFASYRTAEDIFNLIHMHCQQLSTDNNSCLIIPIASVKDDMQTTQLPSITRERNHFWQDDELLRESIEAFNK